MSNTVLLSEQTRTLSYRIARLDRLLNKILSDELKLLDISLPQFTMLSVIERRPGISNAKLAELSFIKPQSTTKIIKELEDKGWITKASDPSHGRRLLIQVTSLGHMKVQECHAMVKKIEEPMLNSIDPEMRVVIQANLETMFSNLKNYRQDTLEAVRK